MTTLDQLPFNALWPDACHLLLNSPLPARLVSLEILDAPNLSHSIIEQESCLLHCFPPSAPFPFLSLRHLALPLGVAVSGRLSFSLTNLRHLPALQSLLIRLHITPPPAVEEEGEEKQLVEAAEARHGGDSVLTQLSAISTLRWLALSGAQYPTDTGWEYVAPAAGLAVIAALFGSQPATTTSAQSDSSSATAPTLRVESLTFHLSLSDAEAVEAVMEGIARHVDPTTCRHLTCSLTPRSQHWADWNIRDRISLTAQQLRHLRPKLQSSPSHHPFLIDASPLSPACKAAIDRYYDTHEQAERPDRAPEQRSSISSYLAAASSGRPCWADSGRVPYEKLLHSLWGQPDRRITSDCLLAITEPSMSSLSWTPSLSTQS